MREREREPWLWICTHLECYLCIRIYLDSSSKSESTGSRRREKEERERVREKETDFCADCLYIDSDSVIFSHLNHCVSLFWTKVYCCTSRGWLSSEKSSEKRRPMNWKEGEEGQSHEPVINVCHMLRYLTRLPFFVITWEEVYVIFVLFMTSTVNVVRPKYCSRKVQRLLFCKSSVSSSVT